MTVYHHAEDFPSELWNQPNPVFGHRHDWTTWCLLCRMEGTMEVAGHRMGKAARDTGVAAADFASGLIALAFAVSDEDMVVLTAEVERRQQAQRRRWWLR